MAWISVKDARAKLDNAVSLQTIYRMVHTGELAATRLRGKILVDAESLERLMKVKGLELLRPGVSAAEDAERTENDFRQWQGS